MKFKIDQVPGFYQGYVEQVTEHDLVAALQTSGKAFVEMCEGLTELQSLYRYEEGKWSIKDMIQHLVDSERVFGYRAMRFARNDKTELSGFEQDDYVEAVFADKFGLQELNSSFKHLRQSTTDLFASLSESELERSGVSNGAVMSVEMIGFIIAGHTLHHQRVIEQKYLK